MSEKENVTLGESEEIDRSIKMKKKNEETPIQINAGGPMVSCDVKKTLGKFKYAGVWYDLKLGPNKVPKAVLEVLLKRGDLS